MGKGENAGNQHFILFLQCFQKPLFQGALKGVVWEWVNANQDVCVMFVSAVRTEPHSKYNSETCSCHVLLVIFLRLKMDHSLYKQVDLPCISVLLSFDRVSASALNISGLVTFEKYSCSVSAVLEWLTVSATTCSQSSCADIFFKYI